MSELNISLEYIRDGSALEQCTTIAQEIINGNYRILNIIISLKECLTHPEPVYRAGGMSFLTNVIKELPKTLLNTAELTHLSEYMCERLKDNVPLVSITLEAIFELFYMNSLSEDCVKNILTTLFEYVPCQQQDKKDRLVYLTILRMSILKFPKVVQSLGKEMMKGFTESIDGERDPKVLVLNFKCFVELSKIIPNVDVTEDNFEVFGVYFPVDFSAPVEENQPFTRDNLSKLLQACLLAYRSFSKYAIPLALEKLDSDFEVAKVDSLEFLLESCNTYEDSDYKPYLHEITKLLRLEILRGQECKTFTLSLMILHRLSETLTESQKEFVDVILRFCLNFLQDDTMTQQHLVATYVLQVTASGSKSACESILNKVIPVLIAKQITINTVIQLNILLQNKEQTQAVLDMNVMTDLMKWLLEQNTNDHKISIIKSSSITLLSKTLDANTYTMIYETILQSIIKDKLTIPYCFDILQQIAKADENFIDIFLTKLLDLDLTLNPETENKIEVLVRLMFIDSISDTACQNFVESLRNPLLYQILLNKLLQIYETIEDSELKFNILAKLINEFDITSHIENNLSNIELSVNEELLYVIKNIFGTLVQFSGKEATKILLQNRCSSWNLKILALYSGTACVCKKSELEISYVSELLMCLLKSSLSDDVLERFFANITIFSLLNKLNNIEHILIDLNNNLLLGENDNLLLKKVECCAWIIKSLLLRSDKRFEDWIFKVTNLNNQFQYLSAVYKILCCECPINDGNISVLHKQKLFIITEKLFNGKTEIKNDTRLFLYNLLMDYIPKTLLHMNKDLLTTILVESIRSEDENLLGLSLYNIKNILELSPEQNSLCLSLYENIDRILSRLLDLLAYSEQQEHVRVVLIIIHIYGNSTNYLIKLIQYKQQVLVCLKKCLNNKSRLIRSLVQKCIESWHFIDMK